MKKTILSLVMMLGLGVAMAQTQSVDKSGSNMKVEGTSTVRDWSADLENAATGSAVIVEENGGIVIKSLKLTFPVHSLKSSEGSKMDEHMLTALKADDNKNITFEMTEFVGMSNGVATVKGKWTMAGSTQIVTLKGKIVKSGDGYVIDGSQAIDITEWSMEPPSLFFGTMNVDPKMTVSFHVIIK